jgi:hypothetical protein
MNIAVIAGVVIAVVQLEDIAAQTKLQSQTLRSTVTNNSAALVLQIRNMLDAKFYNSIRSGVQNNKKTFPILYGPIAKFHEIDVERYIGNFEDIGLLVRESPLISDMAYSHFSIEIEKVWCNQHIRKFIVNARQADKSATASTDPIFGETEKLALLYLAKEHQTCDDLDNLWELRVGRWSVSCSVCWSIDLDTSIMWCRRYIPSGLTHGPRASLFG